MKEFFKKLFDIHSFIGKICTLICIGIAIAAVIGLIIGTTKIVKQDDVVETNYFLNQEASLHDANYGLTVNDVKNLDTITIIDKKNNKVEVAGYFIGVNLSIYQTSESKLKPHKIDKNDFKLKNHTGVYLPLNEIMGAVGWDAIDVHIDDKDGGHVMSSTDFSTTNAYEDFKYISYEISPGTSTTFDLYFEMNKLIDVTKELVVLETDFYVGKDDYKKGTDIVLLNNPFNDENATDEKEDDSFMNKTIELKIDDTIVDVSWLDNNSVKALKELAKDGLTISMSKYSNFEQVGTLPKVIVSSDTRITTIPGDIVLYSSNQLVLFYDSNTWGYTKLGHINLSENELISLLADEGVTIFLSLK